MKTSDELREEIASAIDKMNGEPFTMEYLRLCGYMETYMTKKMQYRQACVFRNYAKSHLDVVDYVKKQNGNIVRQYVKKEDKNEQYI